MCIKIANLTHKKPEKLQSLYTIEKYISRSVSTPQNQIRYITKIKSFQSNSIIQETPQEKKSSNKQFLRVESIQSNQIN